MSHDDPRPHAQATRKRGTPKRLTGCRWTRILACSRRRNSSTNVETDSIPDPLEVRVAPSNSTESGRPGGAHTVTWKHLAHRIDRIASSEALILEAKASMRPARARTLLTLLVAGVVFISAACCAVARPLVLGVVHSESSIHIGGPIAAWEAHGAVDSLRSLGFTVRVLHDQDIERANFRGIDLIVVPDARCIPRQAATAIRAWVVGGGRLLATGMAAYRDEHNNCATSTNNFQWADLYGADFDRWLDAWPHCDSLKLDGRLARETGACLGQPAVRRIVLGRNTAMLVRTRPATRVLATWLDADGQTATTDSSSTSAAICQNGRVIYTGENLLARELTRSPQVLALVLALIRRLDPDAPAQLPHRLRQQPTRLVLPPPAEVTVPPGGPLMRVGIRSALARAGVSATHGLCIEGNLVLPNGRRVKQLDRIKGTVSLSAVAPIFSRPYVALYATGHLIARGRGAVTISPATPSERMAFLILREDGTCLAEAYHGELEFTHCKEVLSVVDIVSLEQYVAGVVPNEMPPSYPLQALDAMAVVARTFGLSRKGFHARSGFDVCSTVHCQVYGGAMTERNITNRAVNATRGQLIEYHGHLADATFHAVCGGVGESVNNVWPEPATPYLSGGADGPSPVGDLSSEQAFAEFLQHPPDCYCSSSSRFRWSETYSLEQLQKLFTESLPVTTGSAWHGLGKLLSVKVTRRSRFGRVLSLQIVGSSASYVVHKDRIRWLWSGGHVGQGGLQSTLFRIVPLPDGNLDFQGGGWGHGVGMCQDGARGMASRGFGYRAILAHYYPHTTIVDDATPSKLSLGTSHRPTGPVRRGSVQNQEVDRK